MPGSHKPKPEANTVKIDSRKSAKLSEFSPKEDFVALSVVFIFKPIVDKGICLAEFIPLNWSTKEIQFDRHWTVLFSFNFPSSDFNVLHNSLTVLLHGEYRG